MEDPDYKEVEELEKQLEGFKGKQQRFGIRHWY